MTPERLREMIDEFHDLRGRWANAGTTPFENARAVACALAEWAYAQDSPSDALQQLFHMAEEVLKQGTFDVRIQQPRTTRS